MARASASGQHLAAAAQIDHHDLVAETVHLAKGRRAARHAPIYGSRAAKHNHERGRRRAFRANHCAKLACPTMYAARPRRGSATRIGPGTTTRRICPMSRTVWFSAATVVLLAAYPAAAQITNAPAPRETKPRQGRDGSPRACPSLGLAVPARRPHAGDRASRPAARRRPRAARSRRPSRAFPQSPQAARAGCSTSRWRPTSPARAASIFSLCRAARRRQ